jgi:hypothetical protein
MDPRVRSLYKKFLWLSKDWPQGQIVYKTRVKAAFMKPTTDIDKALEKGEYIIKEILALYSLKKYRYLKRTY